MRPDILASCCYLVVALIAFLWTWGQPGVSLTDFSTPMLEYTLIVVFVWPIAAWVTAVLVLITTPFRKDSPRAGTVIIDWTKNHWANGWFIHVLAPLIGFAVTMASFTVHKTVVLQAMPFDWDLTFVAIDRWLFGGIDPWRLTHEYISSPKATELMDKIYHPWFYPMIAAYFLCTVTSVGPIARACYLGTYLVSFFVIGCLLAAVFISAGPAYDGTLFGDGSVFAELNKRLDIQAWVLGGLSSQTYQDALLVAYQNESILTGRGISAMPSMHIALAAMWALLFFRINFWLGVIGTIYTVVIWVGSVHLAWHYAVDGIVSSILVVAIWYIIRFVLLRCHGVQAQQFQGKPA